MMKIRCDVCNVFGQVELYRLKDGHYEYTFCRTHLRLFVIHKLTRDEYKILKQKFPDSYDLGKMFYDDEGNVLE